jgi:hypothetical protein
MIKKTPKNIHLRLNPIMFKSISPFEKFQSWGKNDLSLAFGESPYPYPSRERNPMNEHPANH